MSDNQDSPKEPGVIAPLLIAGVGIGCLVGLSVSPVISIVITSVTGSAAAVVAALGSVESKSGDGETKPAASAARRKVNPWPLAALVVGLLIGSIIGILARNNHWFGSDSSGEITKWINLGLDQGKVRDALFDAAYPQVRPTQTASETLKTIEFWTNLDIPKDVVVQRLFEKELADKTVESAASSPAKTDERIGSFLFAVSVTECDSLTAATARFRANGDAGEFIAAIRASTNKNIRKLPDIASDPAVLEQFMDQVLCAEN